MYVKFHEKGLVAVCDEDLIGKKLTSEELDLEITEQFYKGEIKTEEETLAIMLEAENLNIVGEKSVKLAIENGIVEEDNVKIIEGVPHAQVICL